MVWFGKRTHKENVESTLNLTEQLYEKTSVIDATEDRVIAHLLDLRRPDSRYRYLLFCLSTVHLACVPKMRNPDAVLNECAQSLIAYALADMPTFFGTVVTPQEAANAGAAHVQEFLHRWAAYLDIAEGGNEQAAVGIVASMLSEVESTKSTGDDDVVRLRVIAQWIVSRLTQLREAFK